METPDTSISEADQIDRVAFIGERAIGAGGQDSFEGGWNQTILFFGLGQSIPKDS